MVRIYKANVGIRRGKLCIMLSKRPGYPQYALELLTRPLRITFITESATRYIGLTLTTRTEYTYI